MADKLIFGDREIEFLKGLVRRKVDFMIVGLSAAALQGAPVVTQDIDLWFRDLSDPGIRKALAEVGGAYVPPSDIHPPMFVGKAVEFFDIVVHMHGIGDFDEEKESTIKIPWGRFKVPVLKLERIIASKKYLDRDKDRMVLKALDDALVALRRGE